MSREDRSFSLVPGDSSHIKIFWPNKKSKRSVSRRRRKHQTKRKLKPKLKLKNIQKANGEHSKSWTENKRSYLLYTISQL